MARQIHHDPKYIPASDILIRAEITKREAEAQRASAAAQPAESIICCLR